MPDRTYGPYDVINPFHIRLIVVLIAGISVPGYIISRFLSGAEGSLAAGILVILFPASTATAEIYSRQAKDNIHQF